MTNFNKQSAVQRADALLTQWQKDFSPTNSRTTPATTSASTTSPGNAEQRVEKLTKRTGQNFSGRSLVKAAAHSYVALAAKTGMLIEPLVKTWQDGVAEAQRQQERQADQTQGASGAHQEEANESAGQQTLKKAAGAAADAAGTAAGA